MLVFIIITNSQNSPSLPHTVRSKLYYSQFVYGKLVHKCGNKKHVFMFSYITISLNINVKQRGQAIFLQKKAGIAITWKDKESYQAMQGARNAKMAPNVFFTHWYSVGTEKV